MTVAFDHKQARRDMFIRCKTLSTVLAFAAAANGFASISRVDYFVAPNDAVADSEEIATESASYTARISVTA